MARKATDTVQINLRLKEAERLRLVAAARRSSAPTFNGFLAGTLMNALDQGRLLDAAQAVEHVSRGLQPLLSDLHELNVSGDYRRAVGKLLAIIRPLLATNVIAGPTGEAIRATIDEIDVAEHVVSEMELGRQLATGVCIPPESGHEGTYPPARRRFL